jgi:predicted Rdx family selenoprotein
VAVSVAAELSSINYRETAITLTPSDSGRFEVYLDGKKLYDRKEQGAVDFLPALREIHKIRDSIKEKFAAFPPEPAKTH